MSGAGGDEGVVGVLRNSEGSGSETGVPVREPPRSQYKRLSYFYLLTLTVLESPVRWHPLGPGSPSVWTKQGPGFQSRTRRRRDSRV